ncbi:LOW QUALITY PROTEIN: polycystic kidney disease 1 like 1 [Cheilinus undulatus]|uniref:LOW QUALITY PROTEIN: polycystic kidney disease 1 like 1 n=1 Tax=Cheilinus undulatus TaxID=241271 RepID=UPI001BD3048C|nr:LOW QUALITY PROTEIN: polycystic kidney disease 1 like 1 [Cheilinus undulatus]
MPNAFVCYTFILFYSSFHLLSVAVSSSAHGESPWFVGCVNGSSGLLAPEGPRDLDPVTCCERCLDEGVLSLPVGGGEGSIALYRTEGPFLHSVGLSVLSDRVQAGKSFVVEVSGKLAGCPEQPTGLFGIGGQEFSSVSIEFEAPTPTGHSLHRVSVFDDGSFAWSADWIYETPGQYSLTVRVSNPLSICSSTLHLFVTPPSSSSLVISLLHGPLGVPSCIPSLQTDSDSVTVEAVYLDDPVTLQARLVDGLPAEFMWSSTHQENNMEVKTDGVNSTVNWTFETEGVYMVSVNASGAFGWTQETKNVAVCPIISDLKVNESENLLTSTEGFSVAHKNWGVNAEGNRKSSSQIRVNPTWRPPTSQSLVHSPAHVQIYAANQTYPTNTDITLLAVAQAPDPVEFLWHFGDSRSVRTTLRSITKRYKKPGRYDVVVVMSSNQSLVTSDAFPLIVQRAVKLNRLLHPPSVLQNQTVMMSCRVNVGTDPIFLWSFGDGSSRIGQGIEQHIYQRTGEFTVKVTVSNLVSSASLSSHIFVVDRPCQPPPVKNMGPLRLQVQRYEVVRLGVTYDTEEDCDIKGDLHYTWTLFDSEGRAFPLPLIDTQKQSLILPGHLLYYDTYTAVARVQVIGSVVYSNYSVRVQVIPSPPIAFIRGGTNIFINSRHTDVVTFDGQKSYDPDFPMDQVSFSWTCQPVSSITSSCFHHEVPTSSSLLSFPVSFLKTNFDQFHFTLTVHSGERSASSEAFITITPNMIRRVSVYCSQCEGDHLNWDQSFSVSAMCEGCDISSEYVWYSWSLFLVNASSKPVIEVPFCYTLDLGAPSTVLESSTLHPPVKDASVSAFEMRARQLNMSLTDGSVLSKNNREKAGEEPFFHPVRDLDPPEPLSSSTEYQTLALDNSSVQYLDHLGQSDVISEMQIDSDSSTDWELYFPVLESGDLGGQLVPVRTNIPLGTIKVYQSKWGAVPKAELNDLVYEYSISVGDRAPRTLYHGRDFQYYFSLPSGDPDDDYKVTIYTVIRSSTGGPATKPCPVSVQVQPSFFRGNASSSPFDPDLEFSETCLRNLSALVQLGNRKEIQNYISLLTNILNRLSQDAEANIYAQRRMRSLLICALCELESTEEAAMEDNICILQSLLRFTHQVSLTSARRVIDHVQAVSERLSKSRAQGSYHLAQETLNTLVALLSYSLQAAVNGNNFPSEKFNRGDTNQAFGSDSHDENIRNALSNACIAHSSTGDYKEKFGSISTRQFIQLVAEILQTAAELMMRYLLFHEAREHRVSTGFIVLYARNQTQTSSVIISSSSTVYLPSSLIQRLFVHGRETGRHCVLSMLTELTHSPYTWAYHPGKMSGPVVDLSLYRCNSKRKMHFHSLIQPINIELQLPQRTNYVSEHILLRSQINYHSFNITQEHLQQVIQLSVVFTPSLNKAFPIMLLFRMFERPAPSMHHLLKIHHWESNTIHITLPPSYLKAAGVGHLALLNADFQNTARHKHTSERVSYSVTVESSLCLSWDDHQGAWTQYGCMTQQVDTAAAVNCSCQQLRPVTVVQGQIQSSHDTGSLDQFVSVTADLTVLCVLVLCVCLYIPAMVMCKRADVVSKANQGVHYLSDNSPSDPYLYTVTVHTGPCSAAYMSAKVYIMLNGEDGVSQTKELQVPGCTLFRSNSQDTFMLSAAVSLGQVRGVHIWHDNSGLSPSWYLKQVEVSEVNGGKVGGRAWLFVCECWLAVNKGDGQVERRLRVCNQGIGFATMLGLKLSDYFADHHMWISVRSCPSPNSFTRSQRLSVSLLLLMGYSCVNTIIISQMDDQLLLEVGIIGVSAVSVTTGLLSVVAVLPIGALLSFLFRLRDVKIAGLEVQYIKDTTSEKIFHGGKEEGSHYQVSQSSTCHYIADRLMRRGFTPVSQWSHYLVWPLCLLLSFCCLVLSAVVGKRFRSSEVLLWIHSLFFSDVLYLSHSASCEQKREVSKLWSLVAANQPDDQFWKTVFLERRCSNVNKLLGARRRTRFLRHTHPPTRAELRKACWKKRREALICKTLRDFSICFFMLFLMLCINYGGSLTADYYQLNKAVREKFVRGHDNLFMSVQKFDDWWEWAQTSLLPLLYKNASTTTEQSQILIGEPILWKVEESKVTLAPECHLFMSGSSASTHPHCSVFGPQASPPRKCGLLVCNSGQSTSVGLGHRKSEAESRLRLLRLSDWLDRRTVAVKVHFTLFSSAANLFTSVTMLTEQSPTGVLLPSARVQSVRVYHTPTVWDYVVMVCQLLFLFLSLLQLYDQVFAVGEQGLMEYWRTPCNWLEVSLLIVTMFYYTYHIHHSGIALDVVKLLQRRNDRGHIDVDLLATCEQTICSLHGLLLFLLTLKCVTGLRAIRMFATCATLLTRTLSRLLWPMISGLILMVALSCVGNPLLVQTPTASGLLSPSTLTLLCHYLSQKAAKVLLLSGRDLLYKGLLYLFSIVWTAGTLGVVSSLVRCAKASQSRNNVFTITELINFIRQRVSELIGHARGGAWTENQMERRMYHFEEFENVLDELLFKLNTLSDSLHHTLPPKAHCYKEDSPYSSPIQEPLYLDTQDSVGPFLTKYSMLNDHTDVSSHRIALLSHLLRSKPELKQQRSQREDSLFPSTVEPATKTEEDPKDRQLQTYLKAKNSGSSFKSASLVTVCPYNVPEKSFDQRTEKDGRRWLSKTQTNHTEVLVEVLVHGEPGDSFIQTEQSH